MFTQLPSTNSNRTDCWPEFATGSFSFSPKLPSSAPIYHFHAHHFWEDILCSLSSVHHAGHGWSISFCMLAHSELVMSQLRASLVTGQLEEPCFTFGFLAFPPLRQISNKTTNACCLVFHGSTQTSLHANVWLAINELPRRNPCLKVSATSTIHLVGVCKGG